MMTTIPIGGKSGATFNRPFDAGEEGRTPAHSHAVTVTDPGHNHVNVVNDPGHKHTNNIMQDNTNTGGPPSRFGNGGDGNHYSYDTTTDKTGIVVDSQAAKSSVSVSIDTNDAGEHYPLVYVLVCQKAL